MAASTDFRRQVEGYGLTTALIYYRMPDYRSILQEFIWQKHDCYPEFPELHGFLDFWGEHIEGPLHSVIVVHSRLIKPAEIRVLDGEFRFN